MACDLTAHNVLDELSAAPDLDAVVAEFGAVRRVEDPIQNGLDIFRIETENKAGPLDRQRTCETTHSRCGGTRDLALS